MLHYHFLITYYVFNQNIFVDKFGFLVRKVYLQKHIFRQAKNPQTIQPESVQLKASFPIKNRCSGKISSSPIFNLLGSEFGCWTEGGLQSFFGCFCQGVCFFTHGICLLFKLYSILLYLLLLQHFTVFRMLIPTGLNSFRYVQTQFLSRGASVLLLKFLKKQDSITTMQFLVLCPGQPCFGTLWIQKFM